MLGQWWSAALVASLGLAGGLLVLGQWRRNAPNYAARVLTYSLPAAPASQHRFWGPVRVRFNQVSESLGSTTASVRRRLGVLGQPMSLEEFRMTQLTWSFVALAGGTGVALLLRWSRPVPWWMLAVAVILATIGGGLAKDWQLTRAVARSRERLQASLPDAVELLALAVSAGESLVAALERVTATGTGPLQREMAVILARVRVGEPLVEALAESADRQEVAVYSRLCEALRASIERGSPLAQVLRDQAVDCRAGAREELMRLGGKKEIAMLAPVVFLILPITVLFVLFPGLAFLQIEF